MAAGRGNHIIGTVWEPSVMAAGSSPVRLSMPRSSPSSVFPRGADTHRAHVGRVLRTVVRGGHESDRCCHVVGSD